MLPDNAFQSRGGWLITSLVVLLAVFYVGVCPSLAGEPEQQGQQAAESLLDTPQTGLSEANLLIGGKHRFRVEMAVTPEQSRKGLMFRTVLPEGRGMVFSFQPAQPVKFWMKNTKIPLDMLFFSRGRLAYIQSSAPPCVKEPCAIYGPDTAAVDMVVELPAGTASRAQISLGDSVHLEWPLSAQSANSKVMSRNGK